MQDMRPMLQVMAEEKEIHRMLLDISLQKKAVLISNDVNALNGFVQGEKQLVLQAKALEDQRMELAERIASELDIKAESLTFAKIIEMSQEPLKNEFMQLKRDLSDVVLKLKLSNAVNKKLIQTHLDYASFFIRMLTDSGESQTYDCKGVATGDGSTGFRVFDQRI